MTNKISLKNLESLISSQCVMLALADLVRKQGLNAPVIDEAADLTRLTLANCLTEHTKRTNAGRTAKLLKQVAARINPENEK